MEKLEFVPTDTEVALVQPLLEDLHSFMSEVTDRVDTGQRVDQEADFVPRAMMLTGLVCGAFQTVVRARGLDPAAYEMRSPVDGRFVVEADKITMSGTDLGPPWTTGG